MSMLRADRGDLYAAGRSSTPASPTDTAEGDVDAALASAAVTLDATYTTPMEHNNPMEPHTTIAIWDGRRAHPLLVHAGRASDSGRWSPGVFGLDPERVRVISPHVGGGFGSKGLPHADAILAAMAAQVVAGRPVKFALTRQQMFSWSGTAPRPIQRIRLGADGDGRLIAIAHDVVEQTVEDQGVRRADRGARPG